MKGTGKEPVTEAVSVAESAQGKELLRAHLAKFVRDQERKKAIQIRLRRGKSFVDTLVDLVAGLKPAINVVRARPMKDEPPAEVEQTLPDRRPPINSFADYALVMGKPAPPVLNSEFIDAATCGEMDRVKEYLTWGADASTGNSRALRGAAMNGEVAMVSFLIDRGADVHALDDDALVRAAEGGYQDMTSFLLSKKPGLTGLQKAFQRAQGNSHREVVNMLQAALTNVSGPDPK
jgi:hypothetical protein